MHRHPTCFVVGEGLIAARAVEILLKNGFSLLGIHTTDHAFSARLRAEGRRVFQVRSAFRDALDSEPFDYLFSVNNGWIIPESVLHKAGRAAINYHDAPLPHYGGLYATSWALLDEVDAHGITWHEMVAGIDQGRIVAQRRFAVTRADTAHTLNARCYEEAATAFVEVVQRLPREREEVPRALEGGTYYGLGDRPPHAGLLDFEKPAKSLDALVRALDFGPVRNRFAAAKCLLGSTPVVVGRLVDTGRRSGSAPGHVVAIGPTGVVVATSSSDVRIERVSSLSGQNLDVALVCEAEGLRAGCLIESVAASTKDAWGARFARIARHEPYWARRLAAPIPVPPPFRGRRLDRPRMHGLPLFAQSIEMVSAERRADLALCRFAAYAARLSEENVFDLGLAVRTLATDDQRLFAPMVPLRLSVAKEATLSAFEAHFSEELAVARERETYIRDMVARDPELRRRGIDLYGLAVRVEPDETAPCEPFDANLMLVLRGERAIPELWVHEQLGERAVQSIDQQLAELSRTVARGGPSLVRDLPIVGAEEAFLQSTTYNRTERPYPKSATLHALISEQAKRTPAAPAVRFGSASLTYAELDEQSDRLAARLSRLGVRRGECVAVCVPRSIEMVVALLGVLKSGAAYVPIDPAYPEGRIASIVSEARPSAVVAQIEVMAVFGSSLPCVSPSSPPGEPVRPFDVGPMESSDLAYVIFTSGSTGKPKGVEIPHRGIVNHGTAIREIYALGPNDRMLCSASIGFDVCGEQIYPALLAGAEVIIRPENLFESFSQFDDFVRQATITAMVLPTSFWHEWVRSLDAGGRSVPESLRVLSVGTEKALPEFLSTWARVSRGRVRFFQGYGPTETSVTCTMYAHDENGPPLAELPIGRPLPNVRVYVLDGSMRLLPIGMVGELYVGGDGLARGYRNRPDLTAERFVDDPFRPGEKLYRTGDRVRFLPDGNLVYLGRTDFQVKLRGHRIELGEIEATLRQSSQVGDAVVVLREDPGRETRLVAYVVPSPSESSSLDTRALSQFVASRLPGYMVPSSIVLLEAFPMTANQKVDRRALPPPADDPGRRSTVPPRSALERELANLMGELLPGTSVGLADDFFQVLGGSSLLAVRLLDRIEGERGVRIGLAAFARDPTVAGLAALIERPKTSVHDDPCVVVQQGDDLRPPLWLFPAVGGHVVYGEWLRRSMDPEQPLLGVEAHGLDGRSEPLDRIESMAAAYLATIRERQPHGPYYLAGPSMGGLVAIEVARQLRARGFEVPLLVLLDAWGPNYPTPTSRVVRFSDQLRTLWAAPTWKDRVALFSERLKQRRNDLPPAYAATVGFEGQLAENVRRVAEAGERANARYSPLPYVGDVLLVRANRPMHWSGMRFEDPLNGWGSVIRGKIDVIGIDCDHSVLADRPLPEVGRALQRAIRAAHDASRMTADGGEPLLHRQLQASG